MRRRWSNVWNGDVRIATDTTSWGGADGPPIVISHATGFCKEVMHPVVDELIDSTTAGTAVSFDHRNHGASARAQRPHNWWSLADDALAVVGDRRGVIGVGHSCGGAALAYGELARPGTFRALVLIEPIIFPEGPDTELEDQLAKGAMRRKVRFASKIEAAENFADKPAFARWVPEAMAAYIDHGLHPDGSQWRLACDPHDEADFYRQARRHSGWARLADISCPVTIVVGAHSSSHPPPIVARLVGQFDGDVEVVIVDDATHFVPMEAPDAIAALIGEMLD